MKFTYPNRRILQNLPFCARVWAYDFRYPVEGDAVPSVLGVRVSQRLFPHWRPACVSYLPQKKKKYFSSDPSQRSQLSSKAPLSAFSSLRKANRPRAALKEDSSVLIPQVPEALIGSRTKKKTRTDTHTVTNTTHSKLNFAPFQRPLQRLQSGVGTHSRR